MSARQLLRPSRAFAGLLLFTMACGTTLPPKELVDARAAYKRVQTGKANELLPAEVYEAKQALDKAEGKFNDDGDAPETKDLAYVAQRKAQLVESHAELNMASAAKTAAENDMRAFTGKTLEATQADLKKTRDQLAAERQKLEQEKGNVERERQARLEAEKRARQALDDLAKIAAIKEEQRGMVITLSGAVLFTSGKWELLPAAQIKLNEVAEALKAQSGRDIVVEGHTDSQGTPASNLELSKKRADSVREYLVGRGIETGRIRSEGLGQTRPIADNSNPEGRANNRRVEIVVQPLKETR
jgi:outer membrane protein OmpA-like peptidoglycan-associated protein